MVRSHVTSFVIVASILSAAACGGSDVAVGKTDATDQRLQTKKDGTPTGNGQTCSWEGTTVYDAIGGTAPTSPVPAYTVGDEFKSIDGCNECTCAAKGIMCTVRSCGGGTDPGPNACDLSLRICKDNAPPKAGPSCEQICPEDGEVVACTADARKCPDGSFVPRVAPKCEFAACPGGGTVCGAPAKQCPDGSTVSPGPNCVYPECPGGNVACTADAKKCPDGSYVGRTGPKCEFAACPSGCLGGPTALCPCTDAECGPKPGAPNYTCPDGKTIAGPGECSRLHGKCGYPIIACP